MLIVVGNRVRAPTQKTLPHPNRKFQPNFEEETFLPKWEIPTQKLEKEVFPTGYFYLRNFVLLISVRLYLVNNDFSFTLNYTFKT